MNFDNSMKNFNGKKAILGGIMGMFVATIAIILILIIFVFISSIVKEIGGVESGVSIPKENEIGLNGIFDYMNKFAHLTDARFLLQQAGMSIMGAASGTAAGG